MQGPEALRTAIEQMDLIDQMVTRYPDTFQIATNADDIEHIFKSGKIASLIGIEGGLSVDGSLAVLRTLFKLGARSLTPSTDRCDGTSPHPGLTTFGESVVREMNWLGMLVDLSHASNEAILDALRVTKAPVFFMHGGCGGLTDEILRKVRDNGGIVSLRTVDEIDYVRKVAGIDHIGLGSGDVDSRVAPAWLRQRRCEEDPRWEHAPRHARGRTRLGQTSRPGVGTGPLTHAHQAARPVMN